MSRIALALAFAIALVASGVSMHAQGSPPRFEVVSVEFLVIDHVEQAPTEN